MRRLLVLSAVVFIAGLSSNAHAQDLRTDEAPEQDPAPVASSGTVPVENCLHPASSNHKPPLTTEPRIRRIIASTSVVASVIASRTATLELSF